MRAKEIWDEATSAAVRVGDEARAAQRLERVRERRDDRDRARSCNECSSDGGMSTNEQTRGGDGGGDALWLECAKN